MKTDLVEVLAKAMTPSDYPNWPLYRDWARTILRDIVADADLSAGTIVEIETALAKPDRVISHRELSVV